MAYMDTEYPGGLLMQKLGEAVRYDSWTLIPYFKPKYLILRTLFKTRTAALWLRNDKIQTIPFQAWFRGEHKLVPYFRHSHRHHHHRSTEILLQKRVNSVPTIYPTNLTKFAPVLGSFLCPKSLKSHLRRKKKGKIVRARSKGKECRRKRQRYSLSV